MQRRIVAMEHGKIMSDTKDPVLDRAAAAKFKQEPSSR
jgi:hypothetical protein